MRQSMNGSDRWAATQPKLIAILRGITTAEVPAIVECLLETGFRAIEIPLNSPDPIPSIAAAVASAEAAYPGVCLIGAGTVLTTDDVAAVAGVGGNLIVSPNANPDVIRATIEKDMVSLPGVFTPTEAHLALAAGASGLKFFPASLLGAEGIKAIRTILPPDTAICAVGGITPTDFAAYQAAGVSGFGLGSDLYKPGMSADDVRRRADAAIRAFAAV